jgi:hypothetical protein
LTGQGGGGAELGVGDDAKLTQQPELVAEEPGLDDKAVHQAPDARFHDLDRLASGRDAEQPAAK